MDGEDSASRSHEPVGSATTTSSRSGFPSSACSNRRVGTLTSSMRPRSSTRTSVSTMSASRCPAASSSAPRAGKRRARTTPTARRLTGIRGRTSTTSRGRRVLPLSICRSDSSIRRCRRSTSGFCCSRSAGGQADRYFAIISATLKRYGEWFGAYPYGYLTVVDPAFQSDSDGMEYPTLVTGRSRWLTPAQQPDAGGHDGARSRTPVVVRDGRHQRIRARVDGRRDSTPTRRHASSPRP